MVAQNDKSFRGLTVPVAMAGTAGLMCGAQDDQHFTVLIDRLAGTNLQDPSSARRARWVSGHQRNPGERATNLEVPRAVRSRPTQGCFRRPHPPSVPPCQRGSLQPSWLPLRRPGSGAADSGGPGTGAPDIDVGGTHGPGSDATGTGAGPGPTNQVGSHTPSYQPTAPHMIYETSR